jgi:hypothetical protein
MIFGVSLIRERFERINSMWRAVLFTLFLSASLSMHLGAGEVSCPPWDGFRQEQIISTALPKNLERILLHYHGKGLFSKFEEEKKILILQRPLRSSGELIFLPRKGLYRKIITPIQQELVLTRTAIRRRDHHGRVEILDLDKLPAAKALIDGFLAVFSGSWEPIHTQFQVYFSSENPQWKLGLKPKNTTMSHMIACIIMEGEREQIHRLWVRETTGDMTSISSSNHKSCPPSGGKIIDGISNGSIETRP